MHWYELQPPTLELGRTYKTLGGTEVRMVSISNAGKEHETMVDEEGVHRYSRSHGRIIGRCTGSDVDDPLNILFEQPATPHATEVVVLPNGNGTFKPFYPAPAAPAQAAAEGDAMLHHPSTPFKAEFDALYQTLCVRSITVHEIARRCWKAGVALASKVQPKATAPAVVEERDRLRAAQAAAVMPLIGPLLDAWEGADHDALEGQTELAKQMEAINFAMETAGDEPQTPAPAVAADEREAFEAWVRQTRGSPWPVALDRADAGNYLYLPAVQAWEVWQARAALAQRQQHQAVQTLIENPGSPEARAAIDAELAAYGYPANPTNAARAGFSACLKLNAGRVAVQPLTDAERINWLEREANELRTVATAEDDFDWVVISSHMDTPREREIGRGRSARSAIDAAMGIGATGGEAQGKGAGQGSQS